MALFPRRGGLRAGVVAAQCLGGGPDGLHDVPVAGAAAEVALQAFADLLVAWIGVAVEQIGGRHDEARRAVAALQPVLVPEGLLDRVQRPVGGRHALDGLHLVAIALHGEEGAGLDSLAIEKDGAGAALAGVTTDVRARKARHISQVVHQQEPRLDLVLPPLAVYRQRDFVLHSVPPGFKKHSRAASWGPDPGPGTERRRFDFLFAGYATMCSRSKAPSVYSQEGRMQIENEFEVAAPPDRVFSFLLDVNRVVGCMPGAELSEVVDPDNFKGRVKIKVGPITVAYNGTARIAERDETARRAVLQADGRDTSGPGSARASAVMTVVPAGSGSMVKLATDFNVAGRIANFGRGVMEDVSKRLVGQMAQCIKSNLESEAAEAAPAPEPAGAAEPVGATGPGAPQASAGQAPAPGPPAGDAPGQPASPPYAPPPGAATTPARTAPPGAPVNALSLLFAVIWRRIKALFGRR